MGGAHSVTVGARPRCQSLKGSLVFGAQAAQFCERAAREPVRSRRESVDVAADRQPLAGCGRRPSSSCMSAIQDLYPDEFAHCYGCGRLNAHGLHIRSEWTGAEAIAHFRPAPYHIAVPGFVYGGLVASLIDCHAIGTAAAAAMAAAGHEPGRDPTPRFVAASLQIDFLKPTPADTDLVIRGRPTEVKDRKVVVEATVSARGVECARGRVVAVRLPSSMAAGAAAS